MQMSGLLALYFESGPPPTPTETVTFLVQPRSTNSAVSARQTTYTAQYRPTTFTVEDL